MAPVVGVGAGETWFLTSFWKLVPIRTTCSELPYDDSTCVLRLRYDWTATKLMVSKMIRTVLATRSSVSVSPASFPSLSRCRRRRVALAHKVVSRGWVMVL